MAMCLLYSLDTFVQYIFVFKTINEKSVYLVGSRYKDRLDTYRYYRIFFSYILQINYLDANIELKPNANQEYKTTNYEIHLKISIKLLSQEKIEF